MSGEVCPATLGEGRRVFRCAKPAGHRHLHDGGGAVWWHGNGEACPRQDCHCTTRAALTPQPETSQP